MPRFSIVVPTRDRPGTLVHALATCLDQDFDDYEVLVCDNGSSEETSRVVRDLASARIRYMKAPRPLAMSDNWELALSEAHGEYVLVLGDDDGMLGHALAEVERLINRAPTGLVRWGAAVYTWPDMALPGQGDYLSVSTSRDVWTERSADVIADVVRFASPYVRLPMLYNTAVRRDLLDTLRARTGRVFRNRYPDVYSGFALAFLAGSYLSTDLPMTIAGLSGSSSGIANLFLRGRAAPDIDFRTLNDGAQIGHHPWVPDLPIFPEVPVAESFQVAKEALFPEDETLTLDRRQLLEHCIAAIGEARDDASLNILRASTDDMPALRDWLDGAWRARTIAPRPPLVLRSDRLGWRDSALHLDAADFGVADVAAAARLVEHLLRLRDRPVTYVERTRKSLDPPAEVAPGPMVPSPVVRTGLVFTMAIPARGQAEYLSTALASLASQGTRIELAVLDASPDDSVQDVLSAHRMTPAYAYHHADGGQSGAIQEGWDRTTGDIVAWLCADDYLFPDALSRVADVFNARPDVDVVFGHGVHVSPDGAFEMYFPATDPDVDNLRRGCTICQPACFVRRQAMQRVSGLDRRLHYVMDWDFWLRLHGAGCRFHFLNEPLAAVRVYPDTKTRSGGADRRREIARILEHHGAPWTDRARATLGFWKADALTALERRGENMLAEAMDVVANEGRRAMGRPRPTIRGLEAWTNRVDQSCTIELPWYGDARPSEVSVITDRPVSLSVSSGNGSIALAPAGTASCEFRGQTVSGHAAHGRVGVAPSGHVVLSLTGDQAPWRLWQVRLR